MANPHSSLQPLQTLAPGMERTFNWLKKLRLHKYWAVVSRWTYSTLIELDEDNIDWQVKAVGGSITRGARGKLLRCAEDLRNRKKKLDSLLKAAASGVTLSGVLGDLFVIVETPFPNDDSLGLAVMNVVREVNAEIGWGRGVSNKDLSTFWALLYKLQEIDAFTGYLREISAIHAMTRRRRNDRFSPRHRAPQNWPIWPSGENCVMFDVRESNGVGGSKQGFFDPISFTESSVVTSVVSLVLA